MWRWVRSVWKRWDVNAAIVGTVVAIVIGWVFDVPTRVRDWMTADVRAALTTEQNKTAALERDNGDLRRRADHAEEMLAPFQAAALKAFPGEEQNAAVEKLIKRVDELTTNLVAVRENNLVAHLENCYVETVKNQWAIGRVKDLSTNAVPLAQPQLAACTRLMQEPSLDSPLRMLLVMHLEKMDTARRRFDALLDSCGRNAVNQRNIADTQGNSTEWLGDITELKAQLKHALAVRQRPLPIVEGVNAAGQSTIGVCLPKTDG
jgi:hypothetical protein